MKTKINYPYIYVLLQSNTVLVYKMEPKKYISVSDFFQASSKWEMVDITCEEDFETFDHKEGQADHGGGYVLNPERARLRV